MGGPKGGFSPLMVLTARGRRAALWPPRDHPCFAGVVPEVPPGTRAPFGPGNAVAGPVWPGRAVAGPVGRTAPPQIGRGRRGCGPLVATHPPIRPGAAGWASGIPAGSSLPTPWIRGLRPSFGAPRPADSDTPLPGRPPSRRRGRASRLKALPPLVPRPALRVEAPRVPVQAFGPGG